jgi:carbamoyltransferase
VVFADKKCVLMESDEFIRKSPYQKYVSNNTSKSEYAFRLMSKILQQPIIGTLLETVLWTNYKRNNHDKIIPFEWMSKFDIRYAADDERYRHIEAHLKIDRQKFFIVDHHALHATYAYFASPFRHEKVLILTSDGIGDYLNSTVSVADEYGRITRISEDYNLNSIGRIYNQVTTHLGMKGLEHEYKVMGLAPYCKEENIRGVYEIFQEIIEVDGLHFRDKINYRAESLFDKKLKRVRFDRIAGALQKFTEDTLAKWVGNAIRLTGVEKLVFAGGTAMNVKANMTIGALPEVSDFYVPPSPADESNAIGAAFWGQAKYYEETDKAKDINNIKELKTVYLGPEFNKSEITEAIEINNAKIRVRKTENIASDVAQYLSKNKIVARFAGRMEFGARALGNRSILANPSTWETVRVINEKIKNRDFWMPFTPSILKERAEDYMVNPKGIRARHRDSATRFERRDASV